MYKRTGQDLEHYLGFGAYQIFHGFVIQMVIFVEVVNMSLMGYAGVSPTMFCVVEDGVEWNSAQNPTELCQLINNASCGNYTEKSEFYSVVMEWGLVCDKVHVKYIIMSVQMMGVFLGAPAAGQISDLFGRKMTMTGTLIAMIFTAGSSILAQSWIAFTIFRFFIGIFVGGTITCMYVFLVEFLKQRHRLWVTAIVTWPWGYLYMGLLGWLTQDWRAMTLYNNLLGLLLLPLIWFTKESPRWLIQRGYPEEAAEVFKSLARWNRQPIDAGELRNMIEKELGSIRRQNFSFWHLCYTASLSKNTIVLALSWFTVSIVGYAVVFNMGELSGSMYLNSAMYGGARIGLMFCVVFLDVTFRCFGRKAIHTVMELGIVVAVVTALVFEFIDFPSKDVGVRWISLGSACLTGPMWMVVYLLSAELYPTPIRNLANSFCSACARIGGILAPQVLYMGHFWTPAPWIIFTALCLVDLLLFSLLLPETKGRPLPEHMPKPSERIRCCGGNEAESSARIDYSYKVGKRAPRKERDRSGTERSESFAVYKFNARQPSFENL